MGNYHRNTKGHVPRYRKQTRGYLIQVAAREFDRVGYSNTSLASVCREAGLTTGALYHYFGSKNDLAEAILAGHRQRIRNMSDEVRSTTGSSCERLAYFLAALGALLAEDDLVRAAARLAVDRTVTEPDEVFAPWARIADELIRDGDGMECVVDPSLLGTFAASLVLGAWLVVDSDPDVRDRLLEPLVTAFVTGAMSEEDRAAALAAVERAFGG